MLLPFNYQENLAFFHIQNFAFFTFLWVDHLKLGLQQVYDTLANQVKWEFMNQAFVDVGDFQKIVSLIVDLFWLIFEIFLEKITCSLQVEVGINCEQNLHLIFSIHFPSQSDFGKFADVCQWRRVDLRILHGQVHANCNESILGDHLFRICHYLCVLEVYFQGKKQSFESKPESPMYPADNHKNLPYLHSWKLL